MAMHSRESERYANDWDARGRSAEDWARQRTNPVALMGLGSVAAPLAVALVAAGFGHLKVWDEAPVSESDLGILFAARDVGRLRHDVALSRLAASAPSARIVTAPAAEEDLVVLDWASVGRECSADVYLAASHGDAIAVVANSAGAGCPDCLGSAESSPLRWGARRASVVLAQHLLTILVKRAAERPKGDAAARVLCVDEGLRLHDYGFSPRAECGLCAQRRESHQVRPALRRPAGASASPDEWDARTAASELARGGVRLLDVRSEAEAAIVSLPDARLIPIGELENSLEKLDRDATWLVYCKTGARSARAMAMMRQAGFERVHHLQGGLVAWRREVDATLAEY